MPGRLRRARAGTALAFGLAGVVYFTWAARLPAVKADPGLSNGQLAVALLGLEAGALAGLQLGGVLVPRTGSRAALTVALPALAVLLAGLAGLAGVGLGASLPLGVPAAGLAGLALLGAGTSVLLPLAVSAAGNLEGPAAPAVARVATLGCLGSFTGPALIGALAGTLTLTVALALPALLVAGTAVYARAVQPARRDQDGDMVHA